MTRALIRSACGAGLLLVACSREDEGPVRSLADASAEHAPFDAWGGDTSEYPDFTQIRCEATLPSLERDVFGVACGYDSCHGDNNPAWDLALTVAGVESRLIGAPALACNGWTRVVPGAPEQSLLWRKLADPVPPCGERMPLGLGRLPDSVLECVRGWIASLSPRGE